jgi:hypothetical protein
VRITNAYGGIALLLASFATTTPAYACMSSGPDGFTSGVIWKTAPGDLPESTMVLKIDTIRSIPQTWAGFTAKVRDGPRGMAGKVYRFGPEIANSCAAVGRRNGFIVVRRLPVWEGFGSDGKRQARLSAISYNESWLNWLMRLFSNDPWQFPGDYVRSVLDPNGNRKEATS